MDDSPPRPGFDFTAHMRRLCVDMTRRLPELGHIDMDRVAVRFCQVRTTARHGIYASLTPLRFPRGEVVSERRGGRWTIERVVDHAGQEMLYLLSFYLPRFLDGPLREKINTVIHELWHVSPDFDGDLRRHAGRCYAHTPRQSEYDAVVSNLATKWLSLSPPAKLYEFLADDFRSLERRHGGVYGLKIRTPKLRRIS